MIDIDFYMKIYPLKKELLEGKKYPREVIFQKMESSRSPDPVLYNIETTNACNMTCEMCPRTTMMTRSIENLDMATYKKIVAQIKPFPQEKWREWETFAARAYGVSPDGMSENHFFLYVIPRVIVLHGYGDPLLDKQMPERIRLLTEKQIPSYFSCNPANINVEKTSEMFANGLEYIKYSVESVDDLRHKEIRGKASNFTESYQKILALLELKKKKHYKTVIVITMLNLNKTNQAEEFARLKAAFKGLDVYVYLKSEDQQWYRDQKHGTQSIHWLEFCQFPWSSMTIKSNAQAVECVEDYNNEVLLGDARKESLRDIWNGEAYRKFRQDHFDLTPGIKCTERCDMKLIGRFIG